MTKAKKTTYPRNMKGNILIYNDTDIQYFHGVPMNVDIINNCEVYHCIDGTSVNGLMTTELKSIINNFEQLDNIVLDDTTMKRIAKFNKEVDIKKLDKEIEEKKKQIDELDEILQDREGRVGKLKNFIKDIYNINLDEDYWMINMYEILDSITWYNGIYESLLKLKEIISVYYEDKFIHVLRPEEDIFKDEQFEIFWMMLVLQFGDYGTSPRYGWLEMDNKTKIVDFIDKITKTWQEENNATYD